MGQKKNNFIYLLKNAKIAIFFIYTSIGTAIAMPCKHAFPKAYQETTFHNLLYPITGPREEGFLKVSKKHTLFYALYGNPNGIPVVVLHGGPGAGCSDMMSQFFDLHLWNVIMFDQRGAMRSEPFGSMDDNTPQHSIKDIELLRKKLGIDKWFVFGGSWGSTLALLYGQEHPENCLGFILRGIFLGEKQDYLHLFYGMGKVFPEAHQSLLDLIPKDEQDDLLKAYYKRVFDKDPKVQLSAAQTFMKFDLACSSHLPNPLLLEKLVENDKLVLSITKAFCHYSKHDFFLKPHQILSNMEKISHLPAIIIHGRWDAICLPKMAYDLYQNWKNSSLWIITDGGHTTYDPSIASALVEATDFFAKKK